MTVHTPIPELPPDVLRLAGEKLEQGDLSSNRIDIRSLRRFTEIAAGLGHREVMFGPAADGRRYTAESPA